MLYLIKGEFMTIKEKIYNYFTEQGIHDAKEILIALNLSRAIVDKYLSLFTKQNLIYRVGAGKYCKEKLNDYRIDKEHIFLRRTYPNLYEVLSNARKRCNIPNHKDYKYYGAKGIKCEMSIYDIFFIWFRDKAWELKRPSIDRIDSSGNYTIENIRFIEQSENSKRAHLPRPSNI